MGDWDAATFVIEVGLSFAGLCALYDIDRRAGTAGGDYWVAVSFWQRGIATEAVWVLLKYGTRELQLTRLRSGVLVGNVASRRVLEKNSFSIVNTIVN